MMKGYHSRFVMVLALVVSALPVAAQISERLSEVDAHIEREEPIPALAILEESLSSARDDAERAAVYWRMASAMLMHGDLRGYDGATEEELLAIYEEAEGYAEDAIAAAADDPLGYFWKSAAIGRWGETKGVLNSLFKADGMRDLLERAISLDQEHADSYYVLGQLYARVPGMVSFGNVEYAVSLARRSVDLMEMELRAGTRTREQHDYSIQLASHLIDRGWNDRKRRREQQTMREENRTAVSALERGISYEGTVEIVQADDGEEAREILIGVIGRLESISRPLPTDLRRIEHARELLAGL